MYALPALSKSKPAGPENLAAVPVPSVEPLDDWPASVATVAAKPATALVGAFGTKPGITVSGLDAGPSPTMFVAYTVTVTLTLFVMPVIVQPVDDPFPVHDCPELAVALYCVMVAPPFDAGAAHVMVMFVLPPVAVTFCGTPGSASGMKLFDALDTSPTP